MWTKAEPIRSYLYTLLAPVLALLTYQGFVTDNAATLWLTLGGAVLGITGAEIARAKVTPVTRDAQD